MIIVLEGPDGTGKSTLANALVEYINELPQNDRGYRRARYVHFGPPDKHPLVTYTQVFDGYKRGGGGDHLVIDRLHWGDLAYGPIYRGQSLLAGAGFEAIEDLLNYLGAVTVLCIDDLDSIKARLTAEHEAESEEAHRNFLLPVHLEEVVKVYWEIAADRKKTPLIYHTISDGGLARPAHVVQAAQLAEGL